MAKPKKAVPLVAHSPSPADRERFIHGDRAPGPPAAEAARDLATQVAAPAPPPFSRPLEPVRPVAASPRPAPVPAALPAPRPAPRTLAPAVQELGDLTELEPPVSLAPRSSGGTSRTPRGLVTRTDGRTLRRFVIYLPPELAQKLVIRCATEGMDLSDAFTEAAEAWVAAQGEIQP